MWSDEKPMNQKRFGCALATLDGKLYAVGGRNEIGEDGYSPTRFLY